MSLAEKKHHICRNRSITFFEKVYFEKLIEKLERKKYLDQSTIFWLQTRFSKEHNNKLRLCVDFRRLQKLFFY
jgi:hypothetical protein